MRENSLVLWKIIFFINILLLNSCSYRGNNKENGVCPPKIVVEYDDVHFIKSTEGNHVVVCYNQGRISNSKISIYGCSGKTEINYFFGLDTIVVDIVEIEYHSILTEIEDSMDFDTVLQEYKINYDGIIYDKDTLFVDDLYIDLKKYVPFVIGD